MVVVASALMLDTMPERPGKVNAPTGAGWYNYPMLLAGDIGGSKALLGLFAPAPGRPERVDVRRVVTHEHPSLEAIIEDFLAQHGGASAVQAASFGVAGPIVDQSARLTNVSWLVDAAAVRARFGFPRVRLINDLEAMAWSVPVLRAEELAVIQEGRRVPTGNAAVIAAGTGGSVISPMKTVPIFRLRKERPVPKIHETTRVRYIWMASRPVLRSKKIFVWPRETSYTSRIFSAWSLKGWPGTLSI